MALNHHLTTLPSEIRQKIFRECFRVDGGYAYNAQSDKLTNTDDDHTPIDLSLRYTCRSIADDTRNIPLSVNTIHFSTAFREDWRSLAGCFNLAATTYYVLEQDFVIHLAKFITPEMYSRLDSKFPAFRSKLESDLRAHRAMKREHDSDSDSEDDSGDDSGDESEDEWSDNPRPTLCKVVQGFLWDKVDVVDRSSPRAYECFGNVHDHDNNNRHTRSRKFDRRKSGDLRAAVSHCLRLIAEEKPDEFTKKLYRVFPHWVGKYSAQDFFNLRFNNWDIPSRDDVAKTLKMLDIADFVWDLPDLWHYERSYYDDDYNSPQPRHFDPDKYRNPIKLGKSFGIRGREKIRFSATATAIRFLGRLPFEQRTQIRRLTLHEDTESVNAPSLHVQGLVPFFKENPLLRVERRVSVFGCIHNLMIGIQGAVEEWPHRDVALPRHSPRVVYRQMGATTFSWDMSDWLIDALAVLDSGIPAESFRFVLESGPYDDFCTDFFQKFVHVNLAEAKGLSTCLENGLFGGLHSSGAKEVARKLSSFATDPRYWKAMEHLVNQTSILRSDFNPGVLVDFESLVEKIEGLQGLDKYDEWVDMSGHSSVNTPADVFHHVMIAPKFEFQTWDEYLEAEGVKA